MKRLILSLLFFLPLIFISAQKEKAFLFTYFKGNGEDGLHLAYSTDGLHFTALKNDKSFLTPHVGISKLMRDPCLIQTSDETFHMVWTAGWTEKGIGYASSRDLISWSRQKYIPVMEIEPEARNCWAPEISYDKKTKQFLIIWATTIPGRFPETEISGDDKYNHRIYSVTTKDFITFSKTVLFYDKGFNVIDATILKVKKNYLMFVKDETRIPPQKNIRLTTSESLFGPYSSPSGPITGKYWAEGPTSIKIGDYTYVYFDKYTEGKMGAVRSKNMTDWEDISDKVTFPHGMRHGTIISVNGKILNSLLKVNDLK
jgi:hypothetical protein